MKPLLITQVMNTGGLVEMQLEKPFSDAMRIAVSGTSDGRPNYAVINTQLGSMIRIIGPVFLILCAALLWGTSLRGVDLGRINDLGLVSVLPLSVYTALGILMISFSLVVHQRRASVSLLFLHVLVLIVIIHSTPPILYGTLRYPWVWKHVGIVDYIQRHGSVNPDISALGAYHNWPGFFTSSALATQITGLKSPLSFANWAPMFFNLLDLGALLLIFKTLTHDQRLIWLSIWFFYLTNWVGQDYYSPQALNYFFHLVILGICLRWFQVTAPPSKSTIRRWLRFNWAVSLFHGLISRAVRVDVPNAVARPFQRIGLMAIVILIFAVVASSHQLTPFMTIVALSALVVWQRCNALGLPILMMILAATWILYGALGFMSGELEGLMTSIGRLLNNVESNLIDLAQVSPGQRIVAIMGRGLSAFLWGLALLGGIRRLHQGYMDLTGALLATAPFAMLMGNSYGGEILFRVYLFSLPFMAFFAAALLYSHPASGTSRWTVALTLLLSGILLVGFFFAHYGKERQYYFTKNEVAAAQYLYSVALPGSLLIEGSRNYPSQFQNYEFFTYVPLASEPRKSLFNVINRPVDILSQWMRNERYTAAYLIITRSQKAEIDMLGKMPAGAMDSIEKALMDSREFRIVYENEDARIFTLTSVCPEMVDCGSDQGLKRF